MAPLNGTTLGEKHRNYNTLLKETIAKGSIDLSKINYDDDDIDNMMRIDIACKERNVDYILDVLKCDDMLYVSRAIKRSVWLITEQEYAHIMNPDYLHSDVFPEMMPKAITKLMLHIRRHLKDEKRVEAFFTYVDKTNPTMALKWLENCSLQFTEEIVASRASSLSCENFKRLCKKSASILKIYVTKVDYAGVPLNNVTFLLKSHTEELLDVESYNNNRFSLPTFNMKATRFLMKHCFQRIVDNFHSYYGRIDLLTFVKYLKRNDVNIETFLLTKCDRCRFDFCNIKPFLDELPQHVILDLLRNKHGIEQTSDNVNTERTEVEQLFYTIESNNSTFGNVYRWYEFAPYEIAFRDLKKFIYAESSAEERHSMLIVLLKSARKNMVLVRTVLQYYHDKHINEPYIYKIRFVDCVLALHDAFRFEDATWNILNTLFHSLEVYIYSTNNVQQCVITVILYKLLHTQPILDEVEQKFTFDTLIRVKSKLNRKEQETLFGYLYNQLTEKLRILDMNREIESKQAVKLIENIWMLLIHWKKEETHHQIVIDYIINISNVNKQLKRDIDIRHLYRSVKPYHRQLFENSLIICPCEEMCINALKHDPGLLVRYESEVAALCRNDSLSFKTLYNKLRIYWRESLASEWRNTMLNNLTNLNEHRGLVRGVFVLSPHKQLRELVTMHAPNVDKIKWSEANEVEVSLQKHIAKNLHIARPQLPAEMVLLYAKGDYLQYSMFSVNAVYHNLRLKNIQNHIKALTNTNVSLQKIGIHFACAKMKREELLDLFLFIWKSTRNPSIRNMLFQPVSEFLRKAEDSKVKDIWQVLSYMIDDLNYSENKRIYYTLGEVEEVPLSIINEYYKKCYVFLRDLPERFYLRYIANSVFEHSVRFMQYLDPDFVESTLLVSVYDIFSQDDFLSRRVLSAYLLCSKDESTQFQKLKSLFEPLFELCLPKWKIFQFESNVITGFQKLIGHFGNYLPRFVFELEMVMPVKMMVIMGKVLKTNLCGKEHYVVLTQWKLFTAYIKLLNDMKVENPDEFNNWESVRNKSINRYAKICLKHLKEDMESLGPSIYMLFADAMYQTCKDVDITRLHIQKLLNRMLICNEGNDIHVYMLVLKILPNIYCWPEYRIESLIRRKIYHYPSKELRMHYFATYGHKYKQDYGEYADNLESDDEKDDLTDDSEKETSESDQDLSDDESENTERHVNASPHNISYKWPCSMI